MNYPQAYLVIHKNFAMPTLATLKAWSKPCKKIYAPGLSTPQKKINSNISAIREMHHYITADAADHTQLIVLQCKEIPDFLYMALGNNLAKIYWLDDNISVDKAKKIAEAVSAGISFNRNVYHAEAAYSALLDILTELTGEEPFFDDTAHNFFTSRMWGNRTVAEIMIKKIATNVTRQGIRIRLDL